MSKHLSMEDYVKKYQYLTTNSPRRKFVDDSSSSPSPTSTRPLSPPKSSSSSTIPSEDTCKVCLDAESNCAFIECGHIVCCLNCAKVLTRCPVCRETIKRILRIYKS